MLCLYRILARKEKGTSTESCLKSLWELGYYGGFELEPLPALYPCIQESIQNIITPQMHVLILRI